jgi:hypothetical protein
MRNGIIVGLLAICCTGASFGYIVDGARISHPRMLSYAKSKLKNQGTIEQANGGVTYLKVSDGYIKELFKQIQTPGYKLPSGAQISVISEQEAKNIAKLQELGQTIHFKPLGFYTIVEDDLEYFMLAVDAPELSYIRQKYGLSEKLENHAFKITIGVRQLEPHVEDGTITPAS